MKIKFSAIILTLMYLYIEVLESQCYILRDSKDRHLFEINSDTSLDPVDYESSEDINRYDTKLNVDNERLNKLEENNNLEAYFKVIENGINKPRTSEETLLHKFGLQEELNKPKRIEDSSVSDYVIDNWLGDENPDREDDDDFNDVNAFTQHYYNSKYPTRESKGTGNNDIKSSSDEEESSNSLAEFGNNKFNLDSYFAKTNKRNLFDENGNRQLTKDYKNSEETNLNGNEESNSFAHEFQVRQTIAQNNEDKQERNVDKETNNEKRDYKNIVERRNENNDADNSEDENSIHDSQENSIESDTAAANTDVASEVNSDESKEGDVFYNSMVTKIAKLYGYNSKEEKGQSSPTHGSSDYTNDDDGDDDNDEDDDDTDDNDEDDDDQINDDDDNDDDNDDDDDDDDDDDTNENHSDKDFEFSEDGKNSNVIRALTNNNDTYKDVYNVSTHNINKKTVGDTNNSKRDEDDNRIDDDGDDKNDDEDGDEEDDGTDEYHNDKDDNDDKNKHKIPIFIYNSSEIDNIPLFIEDNQGEDSMKINGRVGITDSENSDEDDEYKDVYNVSIHNINKKNVEDTNSSKHVDDNRVGNDDDGDDKNDDEDDDEEDDDTDESHNDKNDNDDENKDEKPAFSSDDIDKIPLFEEDKDGEDSKGINDLVGIIDSENSDEDDKYKDDDTDENRNDKDDKHNKPAFSSDDNDNIPLFIEDNDGEVSNKTDSPKIPTWRDVVPNPGNSEIKPRSAQEEKVICAFGWRPNSKGVCQPSTTACESGFVRNYAGDCINPGAGYEKY